MPQDDESFDLAPGGREDYVPVVVAKTMDQAEKYRDLLDEHDIPAITDPDYEEESAGKARRGRITRGVPVLVPEALLDEASEIIADCEELDEFAPAEDVEDEDEEDEEDEIEEGEGDEEGQDLEDEELEEDEIEEEQLEDEEEIEDEDEEEDEENEK